MPNDSRVAWREGLFLRPQHFQHQDRYTDKLVRARSDSLRPYAWGLLDLKINEDLASLGKFGIERAVGILPDGQTFSIPGDQPPPPPIDVPGDARDAVVYLTLPARQDAETEFQLRDQANEATRYFVLEEEIIDTFADQQSRELIETARPNLAFGVTRDQTFGRVCAGLARIREVHNNRLIFDDRYIPPCLDIQTSTRLRGFISDIIGRAEQRVDELSVRAVDNAAGGTDSIASFLLLLALNRWAPVLRHLGSLPTVHPDRLFEAFAGMAGELATMTRADRKPPDFPAYDHEQLQLSFEPIMDCLQASLSAVFDRSALQLPLMNPEAGVYYSPIEDRSLYQNGLFYLAVTAQAPLDDIRAIFPGSVRIGAIEKMETLVRGGVGGVKLDHAPNPPPQIRLLPGYVYFQLDRGSTDWRDFARAASMGMHVGGDWPALRLELWCVKKAAR